MKYFKMLWATLIALFGVLIYAAVSSMLVEPLPEWFALSAKPVILPSSTCFAICWCVVYVLSTLSAARVIYLRDNGALTGTFVVSAFLNIVWQLLFFKGGFVAASTIFMFFLVSFKIVFLIFLYRTDKRAGLFFTPVIIWYSFLCALSYSFWLLNR